MPTTRIPYFLRWLFRALAVTINSVNRIAAATVAWVKSWSWFVNASSIMLLKVRRGCFGRLPRGVG